MKTMKYYYDLFLKRDVLSLTDLFENFRNNSSKNYWLFPSHCLSTTGLSKDTMLKINKNELELISDCDMYIFFEKGTRDRIAYVSNKYNKPNNKYLKHRDPKQE